VLRYGLASFSANWFSALQRTVEALPRDMYRAKGIVGLDLETGDYGILQVMDLWGMLALGVGIRLVPLPRQVATLLACL
jgi:hypothetical protein